MMNAALSFNSRNSLALHPAFAARHCTSWTSCFFGLDLLVYIYKYISCTLEWIKKNATRLCTNFTAAEIALNSAVSINVLDPMETSNCYDLACAMAAH